MDSIQLIRRNLELSETIVLARIEEMRDFSLVPPTESGGCHTLWVLGHLAYIESMVVCRFMLGQSNPLAEWEEVFDGSDVSPDEADFPSFDVALAMCRDARAQTVALMRPLDEADLDVPSRSAPEGAEELFRTTRDCLQYCSDHWYMHRGHLADARRSAGLQRMWY